MRDKVKEVLKDKLMLVMLVLGLLTIVAAAGVVTITKERSEQSPYLQMDEGQEQLSEPGQLAQLSPAGDSNAEQEDYQTDQKRETGIPRLQEPSEQVQNDFQEPSGISQSVEKIASGPIEGAVASAGTEKSAAKALILDFQKESKMSWPLRGNVILDYSMDQTIFRPTLNQYQCNPSIVIQGEVSTPVYAPANAKILEVNANEEIGNYLKLDLGNDYTAICGQLKEIGVTPNEYVEKGKLLGYLAEPTKYYSIEGPSLYLELRYATEPQDPLDYLE